MGSNQFYTYNGITIIQSAYVLCSLQFATVEVSVAFLKDQFGPKLLPYLKREELIALGVCVACFLLGIPHITKVH